MPTTLTDAEKREHLKKVISGFDTAMLVTQTPGGGLRSRPLSISEHHEETTLYFSTAIDSPKVQELQQNPQVNVSMQDKRHFVSITGTARVTQDRALIDRLWSEGWKVWFPKGKDDPSLSILMVEPSEAAYWDFSGLDGLRYVFGMAKGYVTGTKPDSDRDERLNAHVKL
jgi:general stress protein 26